MKNGLKKLCPKPHPEKKLNDLWTDADILIGMYNKARHEIKDQEELLSRGEVALLFLD